jgi:hypothetical protein
MPTAPDSPELSRPAQRGGRMSELAAVEEVENVSAVQAEGRRSVLASGCGAVSTFLAEPGTVEVRPPRGMPPRSERLRALLKALFAQGTRYKDTGRHNAVDSGADSGAA